MREVVFLSVSEVATLNAEYTKHPDFISTDSQKLSWKFVFNMKKESAKESRKQMPPKVAASLAFDWPRIVNEHSVAFTVPSAISNHMPSFLYETSYQSDEIRGIRKGQGDSVLAPQKKDRTETTKKLECLCTNGECSPGSEFCRQPCPQGWSGNLCSIPDDKQIKSNRQKQDYEAKSEGTIYVKKATGESRTVEK